MFVKDQMTVNPVTVTSATTIADAAELMKKHHHEKIASNRSQHHR